MGKNNRARRAAKARQRQSSRRGHRSAHGRADQRRQHAEHDGDDHHHHRVDVDLVITAALYTAIRAVDAGDRHERDLAVDTLASCPPLDVASVLQSELGRATASALTGGWQPREVVRQGRRAGGAAHGRLAAIAVQADQSRWAADSMDARWRDQLASIAADDDAPRPGSRRAGGDAAQWYRSWTERCGLVTTERLVVTIDVLVALLRLPPVEQVIPAPGAPTATVGSDRAPERSADEQRLLERVRNLLHKAEATEFEAEAEAFTAKAHEIITRHAIDAALLEDADAGAADTRDDRPTAVRIDIDDPYADAKSLLLQVVAEAHRCRAVYRRRFGTSTVLGYRTDLAATELLFTSLLVQGQTALAAAARGAPAGTRPRSRSFRSAFLVGFATRVGRRLDEITGHLAEHADAGRALPVLRSRAARVDDEVAAQFPEMVSSHVGGGTDHLGWTRGQMAAEQAQLNFADLADAADEAWSDATTETPAALTA